MDREKVIKGLECCQIGAIGCQTDCPYSQEKSCKIKLNNDAIALLKEQEHLLTEYENLSEVLFKIEKYIKISDLSSLVDGIENGTIVVLQDNGHFIGGTPITETTIKIRRM